MDGMRLSSPVIGAAWSATLVGYFQTKVLVELGPFTGPSPPYRNVQSDCHPRREGPPRECQGRPCALTSFRLSALATQNIDVPVIT